MGVACSRHGARDGCRRRLQHRHLALLSRDDPAPRLSLELLLQEMVPRARGDADRERLSHPGGSRRRPCDAAVQGAQARQVRSRPGRAHHGARQVRPPCPGTGEIQDRRQGPREEHSSGDPHPPAALRARQCRRRRAQPWLPRISGLGGDGARRESAMALHGGIRGPRSLGRGRRSDLESLDRCVRAVSGPGVMSSTAAAAATAAIPSIPRDDDGPVFRAPWEAHAFAMALTLHERGVFTWPEWAAALASEIKRAQAAGDPDTGETYYLHWLATLEGLVARKGVASAETLHRYRDAWDHAADRTPHGKPIELKAEDFAP